ncbi:hypothetical protein SCOR_33880 [Sulfidibacter corallicola]|uniref:Uncharacterized protein n=1 Tax=Sulfidibacter corallicola TaxID=2818388 RepID=A0A8A4TSE9_SULCO|nr:hypothetical protein [Sulfidibacter corallicola]QTD49475.1 hypothetical protein J3U87_28145 [Sulfidibacter corallicola]
MDPVKLEIISGSVAQEKHFQIDSESEVIGSTIFTSVQTEKPGAMYTFRRDDKPATVRFDIDTGQRL